MILSATPSIRTIARGTTSRGAAGALAKYRERRRNNSSSSSNNNNNNVVIVRGNIPENGVGVAVGQVAESDRIYTAEDVHWFGKLVGDSNPLHQAWSVHTTLPESLENHPLVQVKNHHEESDGSNNNGSSTQILVHGWLVASLFTSIFGTLIPGAVYLKQTLDFAQPVYVGDLVTARIEIERIRHWRRKGLILTCETVVRGDGNDKVRGKADVWLPRGSVL